MLKILILGASGMLGHTLFFSLSKRDEFQIYGTVRKIAELEGLFPKSCLESLVECANAYDINSIASTIHFIRPDVVINCIGIIRQRAQGLQPLPCIEINARLPHLLFNICTRNSCRLIHYSTDCVFDGRQDTQYTEEDPPSAKDVYGLTKYLGELREAPALTIRTSIIGPELRNKHSLIEWFLMQRGEAPGYTNAIFSGLPTCEQARILAEYILPRQNISGLYHVAAKPISKYSLLKLVAEVYKKEIKLIPQPDVVDKKTLCADRFAAATGYAAPEWRKLVEDMHDTQIAYREELA